MGATGSRFFNVRKPMAFSNDMLARTMILQLYLL